MMLTMVYSWRARPQRLWLLRSGSDDLRSQWRQVDWCRRSAVLFGQADEADQELSNARRKTKDFYYRGSTVQ